METQEQKRGKNLAARLTLLNYFLINFKNTGTTFGEYLKEIGIPSENHFLAELPKDLMLVGISNVRAESKNLLDYTQAMNLYYYNEFLKHLDHSSGRMENSFDGDEDFNDLSEAIVPEGEYYSAKGGGKKRPKLLNFMQNAVNTISNTASNVVNSVKDTAGNVVSGIKTATSNAVNTVKNTAQDLKDKTKGLGIKIKKANIVSKANKFNPVFAAMRASFLLLVKMNVFNLAKNLSKVRSTGGTRWNKFVKKFVVFGGSEKILNKEIDKGKNKPKPAQKIKKALSKNKSADGNFYPTGVEEAAIAISAAIAAATPLIVLAVNTVKEHKRAKGEPLTEDEDTGISDIPSTGDPETDAALGEVETGTDDLQTNFFEQYKIPIFIGGGLLVAAIVGLAVRALVKKKK